jgi:hypothetical protein
VPDVSSCAPAEVRLWVALDVHKLSIVAATLPPAGGRPEIIRIEHTPKAIRRLIAQLGGPAGLAVAYRFAHGAAVTAAPPELSRLPQGTSGEAFEPGQ